MKSTSARIRFGKKRPLGRSAYNGYGSVCHSVVAQDVGDAVADVEHQLDARVQAQEVVKHRRLTASHRHGRLAVHSERRPAALESWNWIEFMALPGAVWQGDIHCVTTSLASATI
jgi:hypothetical protein